MSPDSFVELGEAISNSKASTSVTFESWISLISEIEKNHTDDIGKICRVYDSFLEKFPLCHGYWKKYAAHKARLCTVDKVVEIYERALQSVTYSVELWTDYCKFSMSVFDSADDVSRLFRKGISFVGKDFLCHNLWDKYIEFEFSQQGWSSLAYIFIQTMRFPTKKLHFYYNSFKKFADILKEELGWTNEGSNDQDVPYIDGDEIFPVIKEIEESYSIHASYEGLKKYLSIGEQFYMEACHLYTKIHPFETGIIKTEFDVKPIDDFQLENWHQYLNFVETQGDFDWCVKLYERCLIPCANYPEFWMRYAELMEMKGGRELANFALDRSTQIFNRNSQDIYNFRSWFMEKRGDVSSARAVLCLKHGNQGHNFVRNVAKRANLEKRLGNFAEALDIYKVAIEWEMDNKNFHSLPFLFLNFYKLKFMVTSSVEDARDVLLDGIKHVPHCMLLIEELIKFCMLYGDPKNLKIVDSVVEEEINTPLNGFDRLTEEELEKISVHYLELVDLCGTVDDLGKAWRRHRKLFPKSIRSFSCLGGDPSSSEILEILFNNPAEELNTLSRSSESNNSAKLLIKDHKNIPETSDSVSEQNSMDHLQSDIDASFSDKLHQPLMEISEPCEQEGNIKEPENLKTSNQQTPRPPDEELKNKAIVASHEAEAPLVSESITQLECNRSGTPKDTSPSGTGSEQQGHLPGYSTIPLSPSQASSTSDGSFLQNLPVQYTREDTPFPPPQPSPRPSEGPSDPAFPVHCTQPQYFIPAPLPPSIHTARALSPSEVPSVQYGKQFSLASPPPPLPPPISQVFLVSAPPRAPVSSGECIQSSVRHGNAQNEEAYNHMWYYYYYQRQQILMQQQQGEQYQQYQQCYQQQLPSYHPMQYQHHHQPQFTPEQQQNRPHDM